MVPDYVLQGAQSGRFCIYSQKFGAGSPFDELIASQTPIPYTISIFDTDTHARIPTFFPQSTFHEAFVRDGAFDCGPTPNIRF
jgi:hypothetical protein